MPNIFRFATSELSQDAFIAWLLRHADIQFTNSSPKLHHIARQFIAWIYNGAGQTVPEYETVEPSLQRKRVDVLVKLSGRTAPVNYILIEDKTYTSDHTDQINGYIAALRKDGVEGAILPIYLKTWVEGPRNDDHTRIYLPDLVEFMDGVDVASASSEILSSWYDHIKQVYGELKGYEHKPIEAWKSSEWHGCFHGLSNRPEILALEPGFGYVANPSGGFIGCWMGWEEHPAKDMTYLQIDAYPEKYVRLTFRVGARKDTKVKTERIRELFGRLETLAQEHGIRVKRPGRMQPGRSSCFAILDAPLFADSFSGDYDEELAVRQVVSSHRLLVECSAQVLAP